MWDDWLLVSVWGGVVALDTTAAAQLLISHPLVSCSVVGLLLGNFPLGFLIGIILELLWLNEFPVGAAQFSEGNIGATVAAAVAVILHEQYGRMPVVVPLSLLVGVAVALIGGRMVLLMRRINTHIYDAVLSKEEVKSALVSRSHYACIAAMFFSGMMLTLVSTVVLQFGLGYVLRFLPLQADRWLQPVLYGILGIGCGVLIHIFYTRKDWWILALGAALSIAVFLLSR